MQCKMRNKPTNFIHKITHTHTPSQIDYLFRNEGGGKFTAPLRKESYLLLQKISPLQTQDNGKTN
ncbi:Uncharacterized protein TCM_015841 [Theobroma cacao]|uniref:Uncharacterized protein n=1 Tax=Theobroma cacao TaxID=3641 RepID=A0A061G3Q7_THECC|nr:Uncharacterized protein TCM_015841 [Theobroma cacao]